MSFSDSDIARLKKEKWIQKTRVPALLARLEASERTITDLLILCDSAENKDAIMEATLPWRNSKAASQ